MFRKRRIPSLSFLSSKSSRQERNRPKGCSSEKDARTKSRHKRKTRKGYLGGGGGCQTSAKERLAFSEKNTREDKTELQFFSFLEFRVLEKRFESLNFSGLFVLLLLKSLSLSPQNCAAVKSVVVWTRRRREKMVRRCFFFRAREMEQNRTDAIAGRDSSRVSVDAEGFALPSSSSSKFGFFLFF